MSTYPEVTGTYWEVGGTGFYEVGGDYYPVGGTSPMITRTQVTGGVWPQGGHVSSYMESNSRFGDMVAEFTLKAHGAVVMTNAATKMPVTFEGWRPSSGFTHRGMLDFQHPYTECLDLNGKVTHYATQDLFAIVKSLSVKVGETGQVTIEPRSATTDVKPVLMQPQSYPCGSEQPDDSCDDEDGPGDGEEGPPPELNQWSPTGRARLNCEGTPGGGGYDPDDEEADDWDWPTICYHCDTWGVYYGDELLFTYEDCYLATSDEGHCTGAHAE